MGRLPVALQVYSIREEAEQDFKGCMKKVKEMGYEGVELAGLYGMKPEEIKGILAECGLIPISAHVPIEQLSTDLEGTVADYAAIGCSYIAVPYLTDEKRYGAELYDSVIESMKKAAAQCRSKNMVLLYHNHDFEFEKTDKGTYFLDELFAALAEANVQTELDTCWVKVAGESPEGYLTKYADRCPLVHIKDFSKTDGKVELLALGEGEQDIASIVNSAKENGAKWLIVEQDSHAFGTPMGNMEKSFDYLKGCNS